MNTITTSIGIFAYHLTDKDHVFLALPTTGPDDRFATIRGVEYHASLHIALIGEWWTPEEPYVSRRDRRNVSEAAKRKIKEVLTRAWAEFIHTRPELLAAAGVSRIKTDIERCDRKIADIERDLANVRAERENLLASLTS